MAIYYHEEGLVFQNQNFIFGYVFLSWPVCFKKSRAPSLLRFPVQGVLALRRTVLLQLQPFGLRLLVPAVRVIAPLALRARQLDDFPGHLDLPRVRPRRTPFREARRFRVPSLLTR